MISNIHQTTLWVSARRLARFILIFWGAGSLVAAASVQTAAFPGALGFCAYATGGRNGTVSHVTTLADSGMGSFRDAKFQNLSDTASQGGVGDCLVTFTPAIAFESIQP